MNILSGIIINHSLASSTEKSTFCCLIMVCGCNVWLFDYVLMFNHVFLFDFVFLLIYDLSFNHVYAFWSCFAVWWCFRSRPCSPSTFVDLLTNDASSAIGLVISDIASTDTLSSIQALAQVGCISHICSRYSPKKVRQILTKAEDKWIECR